MASGKTATVITRSAALAKSGNLAEALSVAMQALDVDRNDVACYCQCASVLFLMHREAEALELLELGRLIDDQSALLHMLRGNALCVQQEYALAIAAHERATLLAPHVAACWSNLATTLMRAGRAVDALEPAARALSLVPTSAELFFNRGNIHVAIGDAHAAERDFAAAVARDPANDKAFDNLGLALHIQGRLPEAAAAFRRAIAIAPNVASPHFNLSLVLLAQGENAEGWREHEWRRQLKGLGLQSTGEAWDGTPRPNETLLVLAEQGLGDTLQFVRYLAFARERVGRIVFACQPPLVPLLSQHQLADEIIPLARAPRDALHVPLLSLPYLLNMVDGIVGTPYLAAAPARREKWAQRLAALPGRYKIGLTWQGNPSYCDDRHRSMPLKSLLPLAALPDVQLISLQKVHGLAQLADIKAGTVIELGPDLDADGAFLDTAAVLQNLDLLICVDSAIGHLAGALGARALILTPQFADWRWGRLDRVRPWYRSARTVRQTAGQGWDALVLSLLPEISALLASR